jgi:uncharacterized protein
MKVTAILIFNAIVSFFSVQEIKTRPDANYAIEKESTRIVLEFLEAVKNKDHQKVVDLLDENVVWYQPGDNRISGIKNGRNGVLAMGKEIGGYAAGTFTIAEIKNVSANGNSVACALRVQAALPVGTLLDVENIDVYKVQAGKIVEVKVHSNNLEEEDNFWGKP